MDIEVIETPIEGVDFAGVGDVYVGAGTRLRARGDDLPCDLDFTLGVDNGKLVVDELTMRRRAHGPAITPDMLRLISIPRLLAGAVTTLWSPGPMTVTAGGMKLAVWNACVPQEPVGDYASLWQPIRNRRGQGRVLTDDRLGEVVEVYRTNPKRGYVAVARHFDIGRSTAGDYIKRAREAGLLED